MIAYKGTDQFKHNNVKYEIGKTYVFDGKIDLCSKGIHVHREIADVNKCYKLDHDDVVVLEVEIPDDAKAISDGPNEPIITNKLKVLRALTKSDIEKVSNGNVKFDKDGNLIYFKYSDGYWGKEEI